MKEKVGEVMQGIVTHLVPQGIFVEIEEFLTEGFIPFSKLKESVSFNEENFEVTLGDKKIRLGDKIMVKILSVNKWAKSMELGLAEA